MIKVQDFCTLIAETYLCLKSESAKYFLFLLLLQLNSSSIMTAIYRLEKIYLNDILKAK